MRIGRRKSYALTAILVGCLLCSIFTKSATGQHLPGQPPERIKRVVGKDLIDRISGEIERVKLRSGVTGIRIKYPADFNAAFLFSDSWFFFDDTPGFAVTVVADAEGRVTSVKPVAGLSLARDEVVKTVERLRFPSRGAETYDQLITTLGFMLPDGELGGFVADVGRAKQQVSRAPESWVSWCRLAGAFVSEAGDRILKREKSCRS